MGISEKPYRELSKQEAVNGQAPGIDKGVNVLFNVKQQDAESNLKMKCGCICEQVRLWVFTEAPGLRTPLDASCSLFHLIPSGLSVVSWKTLLHSHSFPHFSFPFHFISLHLINKTHRDNTCIRAASVHGGSSICSPAAAPLPLKDR